MKSFEYNAEREIFTAKMPTKTHDLPTAWMAEEMVDMYRVQFMNQEELEALSLIVGTSLFPVLSPFYFKLTGEPPKTQHIGIL